jgi:hypothetical protein
MPIGGFARIPAAGRVFLGKARRYDRDMRGQARTRVVGWPEFLWVACLALVTAACSGNPADTGIVVIVDVATAYRADLSWIRAAIRNDVREVDESRFVLSGPDAVPIPFSFTVVPPPGKRTGQVDLTVEAGDAPEVPKVARRVRTQFVPGDFRLLLIVLSPECENSSCEPDMTCLGGRCAPVDLSPEELPPVTPGDEVVPLDGGTQMDGAATMDASMPADAAESTDSMAGMDAWTPPDSGSSDAGTPDTGIEGIMCPSLNAMCSNASECCAGLLSCRAVYGYEDQGGKCCLEVGERCDTNEDCCGSMFCGLTTRICWRRDNIRPCLEDEDCKSLYCQMGKCHDAP